MYVVIAGAGLVGASLAARLADAHHDVVVIDVDRDRLDYVESHLDVAVVEGSGVKLQFRIPGCVLDAYLYGDAVRHVDARDIYGRDVDRTACIAAMDRER